LKTTMSIGGASCTGDLPDACSFTAQSIISVKIYGLPSTCCTWMSEALNDPSSVPTPPAECASVTSYCMTESVNMFAEYSSNTRSAIAVLAPLVSNKLPSTHQGNETLV
jgi:hypothetical protein